MERHFHCLLRAAAQVDPLLARRCRGFHWLPSVRLPKTAAGGASTMRVKIIFHLFPVPFCMSRFKTSFLQDSMRRAG